MIDEEAKNTSPSTRAQSKPGTSQQPDRLASNVEKPTLSSALLKDPVCGMTIDPVNASEHFWFNKKNYFFCHPNCRDKFISNLHRYISAEEQSSSLREQHLHSLTPESKHKADQAASNVKSATGGLFDLAYTCPMDPEILQQTPGFCPICGMSLQALNGAEQDWDQKELHSLSIRLKVAAPITLLLIASSMTEMLIPKAIVPVSLSFYIQLLLTAPLFFWAASPIFLRAWSSLKENHLNMFTLIALGITFSFGFSIILHFFHLVNGTHFLYFESTATIVTLVLFGQIIEHKARKQVTNVLQELIALTPQTANLIDAAGYEHRIPAININPGDILLVKHGQRIPADGQIINGQAALDESIITGALTPANKSIDDNVFSGALVVDGGITIKAQSSGQDSTFSQILKAVCQAQRTRAPMQNLADKISAVFIPAVMITSLCTFAWWLWIDQYHLLDLALLNALSVLVIACPCVLGLATPMVVMLSIAYAAKNNIFVRDAQSLQLLAGCNALCLDKTGTLTTGKMTVKKVESLNPNTDLFYILALAAGMEQTSNHPLAAAIVQEAHNHNIKAFTVSECKILPGLGISALKDNKQCLIGNPDLLTLHQINKITPVSPTQMPITLSAICSSVDPGESIIFLAEDAEVIGYLVIMDQIKDSVKKDIDTLKEYGLDIYLVSGDQQKTVNYVASTIGISQDKSFSNLLPQNKVKLIKQLQTQNKKIIMVGDGVNDAAALLAADVGIAIQEGSAMATDAAGLVIKRSDLKKIVLVIKLANYACQIMKENLFFAFFYNTIGVILATGLLWYPLGIKLNPMIAALAMSFSSVSVILNSLRLKSAKIH